MKHSTFRKLVDWLFYIGMGIAVAIVLGSLFAGCATLGALMSGGSPREGVAEDTGNFIDILFGVAKYSGYGGIGALLAATELSRNKLKKMVKAMIKGIEKSDNQQVKQLIAEKSKDLGVSSDLHKEVQKVSNSVADKKIEEVVLKVLKERNVGCDKCDK